MGVSSKERAIDAALRDGHVDIVILGAGLSGVGAACVDRLIRFGCPLLRASWRSADAFRRLEAKREDGADVLIGDFLYMCTGYNE
jgi:cation diffusion facilitator CzcD-associated flavoprotein CzcO